MTIVNLWQKFLSNKDMYANVKHNEHYIGVIVDNDHERYKEMKNVFKKVNNEKLHRHYHRLKTRHNKYLTKHKFFDKNDDEIQYEKIKTNFEHIDIDNFEEITNVFHDHNVNNNKLFFDHMITLISEHFSGKPFTPDILKNYKKRARDNKLVFEPDQKNWNKLYDDFQTRHELMKYFKHHYTYVFIGKDKTFAFEHHGKKDLPKRYCKNNIIYNSFNLNDSITTKSDNFITNDNSSLASLFDNDFPMLLDHYLHKIGLKKDNTYRIKGTEIERHLSPNYCKCKTDTNGIKITSDCKYRYGTTRLVESFKGNKINETKLKAYYNKEINVIGNSNSIYNNNISNINQDHKSYIELDEEYNNSKGKKDKLKDSDRLYKQMIQDNILISNRNTLIRYLVIIILIFSILLIMKYINII